MYAWLPYRYFYAMTFNRMGTVPLPHAHPGELKVGSADVPHLHVLGRRRQLHHEPRAAELRVFDPDLPADFGHDALTDREAQAGALVGAFGGEKRIEDAAADLPRDARPRVVYRQPDPSLARLRPQLHDRGLPAPHHVLGVGHEIDHHLLQLLTP